MYQGVPLIAQEKGVLQIMSIATDKTEREQPDTRLTLHVQQEQEGQVDSTTLVRWCVTQDFLDDIRQRNFHKPYLVLVVRTFTHYTREEEVHTIPRQDGVYVQPLEADARYIRFKRPGENEIRAFIVNAPSRRSRKELYQLETTHHDVLEAVRPVRPVNEEVDDDEDESEETPVEDNEVKYVPNYRRIGYLNHINLGVRLLVTVPGEMFAKDYPQWIQKVVRRYFPNKDKDQCHFKKRALACIPILLFMFTIGLIIRLVCAVIGLVIGARGDHLWRNAAKPLQGSIWGPLEYVESSFWFWSKKKDDIRGPNPMWILNPIVMLAPAAIVYALMQTRAHVHTGPANGLLSFPGWWSTLLMVDLAIVSLAVAAVLVVLIVMGIISVGGSSPTLKKLGERFGKWLDSWSVRLSERNQRKLNELVCEGTSETVSYEAIPKDKRTIQLRWARTKAKVCKPFAQ